MAVFTPAPKTQGSSNLPGEQKSSSLHRSGVMLRSHRSNSLCIACHLQLVWIFYFYFSNRCKMGWGFPLNTSEGYQIPTRGWNISDTSEFSWHENSNEESFKWKQLNLINLWVLVTFMCKRIWLYVTDMTCWGFPNWRVYKHVAMISLFIPIISISI